MVNVAQKENMKRDASKIYAFIELGEWDKVVLQCQLVAAAIIQVRNAEIKAREEIKK